MIILVGIRIYLKDIYMITLSLANENYKPIITDIIKIDKGVD